MPETPKNKLHIKFMFIQEIRQTSPRKNKKRIGRGGKRGTTSGRGQKGQKARAGHRIRPAERDILSKIPKLRGVKNKIRTPKMFVFNVGDLDKTFKNETVISKKTFLKHRVVKSSGIQLKILGDGDVKKAFKIIGLRVSESAKKKILSAGGTVSE